MIERRIAPRKSADVAANVPESDGDGEAAPRGRKCAPRRAPALASAKSQLYSRRGRPSRHLPRAHRLAVQDVALSRRKHGFDSRWARQLYQALTIVFSRLLCRRYGDYTENTLLNASELSRFMSIIRITTGGTARSGRLPISDARQSISRAAEFTSGDHGTRRSDALTILPQGRAPRMTSQRILWPRKTPGRGNEIHDRVGALESLAHIIFGKFREMIVLERCRLSIRDAGSLSSCLRHIEVELVRADINSTASYMLSEI